MLRLCMLDDATLGFPDHHGDPKLMIHHMMLTIARIHTGMRNLWKTSVSTWCSVSTLSVTHIKVRTHIRVQCRNSYMQAIRHYVRYLVHDLFPSSACTAGCPQWRSPVKQQEYVEQGNKVCNGCWTDLNRKILLKAPFWVCS